MPSNGRYCRLQGAVGGLLNDQRDRAPVVRASLHLPCLHTIGHLLIELGNCRQATALSSSAAAVAKVVITKNKIRLLREVLRDVPSADRPAVLQTLAELL